jgi:hypothetical protein
MTIRLALIVSGMFAASLLTTVDSAGAQGAGRNVCSSLCDCNNLECTDFCSPNQCGRSACKTRFEKMVRECQKACNSCTSLHRSKKS